MVWYLIGDSSENNEVSLEAAFGAAPAPSSVSVQNVTDLIAQQHWGLENAAALGRKIHLLSHSPAGNGNSNDALNVLHVLDPTSTFPLGVVGADPQDPLVLKIDPNFTLVRTGTNVFRCCFAAGRKVQSAIDLI